jgi:hypothetical protein
MMVRQFRVTYQQLVRSRELREEFEGNSAGVSPK